MKEVSGNIWDFYDKGEWIVITTNGTVKKNGACVMGRGVALEARDRFPNLDKVLGKAIDCFGNIVFVLNSLTGAKIITFPVKHNWNEKADLKLIERSCRQLEFVVREKSVVYMVRPGCFPRGTTISVKGNRIRHFVSASQSNEIIIKSKRIENIEVGDEVLCFDPITNHKEFKKVMKLFYRKAENFIIIKFSNGNELKCTLEHPIAINYNGEVKWVSASSLNIGEECLQYKYFSLGFRIKNLSMREKTSADFYGEQKAIAISKKLSDNNGSHNYKTRMKISKALTGRSQTEEHKKNTRNGLLKRFALGYTVWNKGLTKETDLRVAKSAVKDSIIMKVLHKDIEFKKKYYAGLNKKPNNEEIKLLEILDKIVENKFELNVNGEVQQKYNLNFDGLIPDFVWPEGKKVILYNGCVWHCCEWCENNTHPDGISVIDVRKRNLEIIERLKKVGWEPLEIWGHDLYGDKKELIRKLSNFVYNPNIEIVNVVDIQYENTLCDVYNLEIADNNNYFANGILVHNCGNGGLDWKDVKPILEKYLDDRFIMVNNDS